MAVSPSTYARIAWRSFRSHLGSLGIGRQQHGIAAGRCRVDGYDPLLGVPKQRDRAASLWSGARQSPSAEWLHADDSADLVAVDIGVADAQSLGNAPLHRLYAAVDAERQAVAGGIDRVHQVIQPIRGVANHAQHRTEYLALQVARLTQQVSTRCEEAAVLGARRQRQC